MTNLNREDIETAYKALGLDWDWISLFIDFSTGFTFKKDLMVEAEANGEIEKEQTQLGIRWRPAILNTHSAKYDPVATKKGEVDIEYPFHKFMPYKDVNEAIEALKQSASDNMNLKPKIRYVNPTPQSYDGTIDGLLNADEEHSGEDVQNSRGFYKCMSLEEFKAKGYKEINVEDTTPDLTLFMEGRKEQEKIVAMQALQMIYNTYPEVLHEFLTEHYGK